MKKTLRKISMIIFVILVILFAVDYFAGTNIVNRLLNNDSVGPVINIDDLPKQQLLNRDFNYDLIDCTDNVDEICDVEINGEFNTSVLGSQSIELIAIDSSGNETRETYTIIIVENVDGSMYIPEGYYASINELTQEALILELNTIIDEHTVYPYTDDDTDVWDILRDIDEDPDNPDNIIGFYTGLSIPKGCQDTTNPPDYCSMEAYGEVDIIEWNREHIWSKSRGFPEESFDAYTDIHHLVPAERTMNSTKNNRFYEICDETDENVEDRGYGNFTCNEWSFEPRDEVKGDVARMIFYMMVRYYVELELRVINDPMDYLTSVEEDRYSDLPIYGDLEDLLIWHFSDPVSQEEILRNQAIYGYQGNRNPFIDLPELVELIWPEA